MPDHKRWWEERKEELVSVARESGPICVVNEEALNESVFDLLSLEAVDELLFPVALHAHPRMLDALGRVGAGFLCESAEDVDALGISLPGRYASRILLAGAEAVAAFPEPSTIDRIMSAVFDPETVSSRPERFHGRETLVGIPAHRARADGPGAGPLVEALTGAGADIRGVYLPWGGRVSTNAALTALRRWRGSLGQDGVLALGRGMGAAFDEDAGRLDIERTVEIAGGLRDLMGARAVWLDPGACLFSEIGVLLVPVERVFRSGAQTCIRTPEGTAAAIAGAVCGGRIPAWNLTGAGSGEATPMAVWEPGLPEDPAMWPVVVLAAPEPGDVLALPLSGFSGMPRKGKPSLSTQPGVCYLNARRICQVPL